MAPGRVDEPGTGPSELGASAPVGTTHHRGGKDAVTVGLIVLGAYAVCLFVCASAGLLWLLWTYVPLQAGVLFEAHVDLPRPALVAIAASNWTIRLLPAAFVVAGPVGGVLIVGCVVVAGARGLRALLRWAVVILFVAGSVELLACGGVLLSLHRALAATDAEVGLDASEPEAQRYIALATESALRVPGLSDPPSSGAVFKHTPRGSGRYPTIAFSVSWRALPRYVEWNFQYRGGKPDVVCWVERLHRQPLVETAAVRDGHRVFEQLEFRSGTGGACGSEAGFVIHHWSPEGMRVVPPDAVSGVLAGWAQGAEGALPVSDAPPTGRVGEASN